MAPTIPTISLATVQDPSSHKAIAAQMREAGLKTGFFCIVDHGVRGDLIDAVLDQASKFFALSLEEKEKVKRDPWTQRGWDQLANQSFGDTGEALEKGVDLKEGFQVGKDGDDGYWGRYAHGPNVLPDEEKVPGLKGVMAEYYETMLSLGQTVMRLLAVSLDLDPSYFDAATTSPISALRLLRYPAQPTPGGAMVGAGAHRDFGLGTLLVTSGVSGLELWMDDKWHKIEPPKHGIIFNIGDIGAMIMPEYKSSLHRVLNQSGKERFSVPFFLDGASDFPIVPIGQVVNDGEKVLTIEEHMRERFDTSYAAVEVGASA